MNLPDCIATATEEAIEEKNSICIVHDPLTLAGEDGPYGWCRRNEFHEGRFPTGTITHSVGPDGTVRTLQPSITDATTREVLDKHPAIHRLWDAYEEASACTGHDVVSNGLLGIILEWERIRSPEILATLSEIPDIHPPEYSLDDFAQAESRRHRVPPLPPGTTYAGQVKDHPEESSIQAHLWWPGSTNGWGDLILINLNDDRIPTAEWHLAVPTPAKVT